MKYLLYLRYLVRHKWFVFVECCKLGIPLAGLIHDWSKFLPDEFFPYAESFYGGYPPGQRPLSVKLAFDLAWLKHQHRNPHHWQHWVLREDSGKVKLLAMPDRYQREMLADWRGAGRAINSNDDTAAWYLKNWMNIQMNWGNREWIDSRLGLGGITLQVAA